MNIIVPRSPFLNLSKDDSQRKRETAAKKVMDTLIALRLKLYVLDKALGQNQSEGGMNKIDPEQNPAAREFSDLFTTNPRQCDELEKLDEVEFLKCLTEHGLPMLLFYMPPKQERL